jgi:hypothetical protein
MGLLLAAGSGTSVTVTPGLGSLVLTGFAPTVTAGSEPVSVTVTPGTGALVITGYAPAVSTTAIPDEEGDGGHGGRGHAGHGFSKLTRQEIERYRRLRDGQERGVRKHADELVGFAPPDAPDAPTPQPEPVAKAPAVNPLGIAQVAPVEVGAAPVYGPGYAEQQAELLRLEIERIAQAQVAAEAELALARMEAERIAARLRDEDDVLVLLLAA